MLGFHIPISIQTALVRINKTTVSYVSEILMFTKKNMQGVLCG